jgi:hypothetical protein
MKAALLFYLLFAMTNTPPAHVNNSFRFLVHAPLSRAAPLFGPEGERCWAGPRWNPQFLHPQPGKDALGAVFTVQHGSHTSVWVNTVFDPFAGRMQYVAFIPDKVVSIIDVRLTAIDRLSTTVEVTYARTALNIAANYEVEIMGKRDRESGADWQQAINQCLQGQSAS